MARFAWNQFIQQQEGVEIRSLGTRRDNVFELAVDVFKSIHAVAKIDLGHGRIHDAGKEVQNTTTGNGPQLKNIRMRDRIDARLRSGSDHGLPGVLQPPRLPFDRLRPVPAGVLDAPPGNAAKGPSRANTFASFGSGVSRSKTDDPVGDRCGPYTAPKPQ